ncbi:M61 family metallopeptidase [Crocinitomix catalasitica]|uniref:M61 family metallopeptidase n=1 Tax=Crocinitomix catalasitica TaxID=184607 RepID=UPI000685D2C9|nr:M61 family metallopeptidase [Crocinitomix catalasitica]
MNYKITYEQPTQQYILIEAIFETNKRKEIILQFPAWRPGRYELGNFAKNIKNFEVKNEDHKNVDFHKISKDKWQINCENSSTIHIRYKYFAAQLNAGSTYMDDIQLYVNPVNCIIYDESSINSPCEVSLDLPDDFQIACSAKLKGNTIYADSYHDLADSPFIASANLIHKTYNVLNREFHIWIQGNAELDWDKIIADFEKFTLLQLESFSDRRNKFVGFPKIPYHFLYQILDVKAYHGVEHTHNTVIALGPGKDLMTALYDDFLGVSAHELYHAWNVKAIRPTEMYPYDYSKENYSHLGFVAEGVTTYLGDWFLLKSEVKDFSWYKLELEKLFQKHFDNFGRFNYSVAESSWDTWLDGYELGAPNRKVSIYTEGAILAFILDIMIRDNSKSKFTIHDVMFKLYKDFALKNKGYSTEDYKSILEEFTGQNLDAFFKNYYFGTTLFESILVETLEKMGYELVMEQNPVLIEDILGIKIVNIAGKTVVQRIAQGSSAELGGVMHNDIIEKVNGHLVEDNISELFKDLKDSSIELVVSRLGRIVEITCPNLNKSSYPHYKIEKMQIPSKQGKSLFKKWSGIDFDLI